MIKANLAKTNPSALPVIFLQEFIVLGIYSFGSTLPHFQQIPLTARHMLGKVFLSSLFLWHVMPFSPKKLWSLNWFLLLWKKLKWHNFQFAHEVIFSIWKFFWLLKLPPAMVTSYFLSNFTHVKKVNFTVLSFAIIAEIVFAPKVCKVEKI